MTKINEIATLAFKQGKINKKGAFNVVKGLIDGEELDDIALSILYSFFTPPAPAKCKAAIQWIGKARSKEDTRYYLKEVYVNTEHIVACDGHRLHLTLNKDNLEEGYYNSELIKIDLDATYPDYRRVIPDHKEVAVWTKPDAEIVLRDSFNGTPQECYKLDHGGYVNRKYWDAARNGNDLIHYKYDTATDPVILIEPYGKGSKAVVMPMRL